MNLRIGINPLTWSNDDMPELGGEISLETCLKETKQAGYDGIELGNKFPRTPSALKPIMAKHGLDIVSGWYSSALLERSLEAEIAALEPHLSLLEAMGSKVLVLCETTNAVHGNKASPLTKRPKLDDAQWKRLSEGLTKLGEHTAKRGIRLAYHHHMGTVVQAADEIDALMSKCGPSVWLLLDTGHITYAGGDPVALAKRHGARIGHLHTKDVRKTVMDKALSSDWPFLNAVLEGVFTVPGDGMVDYKGVFAELAKHKYANAWVVVEAEQDPKKAHPLTYAKMGYQNLIGLLKGAGLRA
jgi:myo-inosose-2 dehydratase